MFLYSFLDLHLVIYCVVPGQGLSKLWLQHYHIKARVWEAGGTGIKFCI